MKPRFFSQKMLQKLQSNKEVNTHADLHRVATATMKGIQWGRYTFDMTKFKLYLPEKKIPSTAAKATSLSAKQFELHFTNKGSELCIAHTAVFQPNGEMCTVDTARNYCNHLCIHFMAHSAFL